MYIAVLKYPSILSEFPVAINILGIKIAKSFVYSGLATIAALQASNALSYCPLL